MPSPQAAPANVLEEDAQASSSSSTNAALTLAEIDEREPKVSVRPSLLWLWMKIIFILAGNASWLPGRCVCLFGVGVDTAGPTVESLVGGIVVRVCAGARLGATKNTYSHPTPPTPQPRHTLAFLLQEIELTALECSLCLSLFCEPVTISCGHTFCRTCLVSAMGRAKKKCPNCRAVCHLNPHTHAGKAVDAVDGVAAAAAPLEGVWVARASSLPLHGNQLCFANTTVRVLTRTPFPPPPRPIVAENSTVAYICKTCFPLRYEQRLRETEEEKSGWSSILPVFYYNDVVFPGHPLKLHFFEHRYKTMMRRCVEGDRKFAYIPNFTDYEAAVGDVCLRVLFCFFFLAIVFGRCREHGKLSVNPVVDR